MNVRKGASHWAGWLTGLMVFSYVLTGLTSVGRGGIGNGVVLMGFVGAVAVSGGRRRSWMLADVAVLAVAMLGLVRGSLGAGSSAAQLSQLLGLGVLPYLLLRISARPDRVFESFLRMLCLLAIPCGLILVSRWLQVEDALATRIGNEALNPNGLGLAFGAATIAGFGIFQSDTSKRWRILGAVSALVSLGMVLASGMRSAMGAVVLATLLIALSSRGFGRRVVVGVALVLVTTGVAWAALTFVPDSAFVLRVIAFEDVASVSEREILIEKAVREIADRPIWGWGLGAFERRHGTYPHNLLLELLHTFGVAGLAAYLTLLVAVLAAAGRALIRRTVDPALPIAVALFIYAFLIRQTSISLAASKDLLIFAAFAVTLAGIGATRTSSRAGS